MASRATSTPPRPTRPARRQASLGDLSAGNPLSRPGSARMAEAKPSELQDIWRRYKSSGGQDLRDRLILTYAPLVKYVAGRLGTGLPAHVEEGDLISYGLLRLVGGIERHGCVRTGKSRRTRSRASRARLSAGCRRSAGCRARYAAAPARSSAPWC